MQKEVSGASSASVVNFIAFVLNDTVPATSLWPPASRIS